MWAQRTKEWQYPSLVQLIMVKFRETAGSPPRPAKNCLTVSLLSTFVRIDRYVFEKRWIISDTSGCVIAHFRERKV